MQNARLFRQKPLLVEAVQWFKLGDHSEVVPGEDNAALIYIKEKATPVSPGDWIVHELGGDYYVHPTDYFDKHFQPTEQSYIAQDVKFETFIDLEEAREYRSVYGGYLLRSNDYYAVCDEERAIELLCLRPLTLKDAMSEIKKIRSIGFDETKIKSFLT